MKPETEKLWEEKKKKKYSNFQGIRSLHDVCIIYILRCLNPW